MKERTELFTSPSEAGTPRTIFQEQWWLDASAGSRLESVQVERDGKQLARLFFVRERRFGLQYLTMPPYTRTLGPILDFPQTTCEGQRLLLLQSSIEELVRKLPKHDHMYHLLDPEDETPFYFKQCGFDVSNDFTFRVDPQADISELETGMDARRKKRLKQRQKDLLPEFHFEIDRFIRLATKEYSREISHYDFDTVSRIFKASAQRGRASVLSIMNLSGVDVCACVLVWDDRKCYFWLATRDHEGAARGAKTFALWKAMLFAHERGLVFDVDGYASISGARFMITFGIRPIARPLITRASVRKSLISPIALLSQNILAFGRTRLQRDRKFGRAAKQSR